MATLLVSLVVSLGSVTVPLALNCESGVPVSGSFDFEIIEVVALVCHEKRRFNKQAVQSLYQTATAKSVPSVQLGDFRTA